MPQYSIDVNLRGSKNMTILELAFEQKEHFIIHKICSLFPKFNTSDPIFIDKLIEHINIYGSISEEYYFRNFLSDIIISIDDINVLTRLIESKISVNSENSKGMYPIIAAVKYHKYDVLNLLLRREDINIDCQDKNGNSPLLLLAHILTHTDDSIIKYINMLFKMKPNINIANKNNETFSMSICHKKFYHLLEDVFLYCPDINLDFQDNNGNTLLIILLEHLIFIGDDSNTQQIIIKFINIILEKEFNVNLQNNDKETILLLAITSRNEEIVKKILHFKPDLSLKNRYKINAEKNIKIQLPHFYDEFKATNY